MSKQRIHRIPKRVINVEALKQYIASGDDQAKLKLSLKSKISIYTLDRFLSGTYPSAIRMTTRALLCGATGLEEDELFPILKVK